MSADPYITKTSQKLAELDEDVRRAEAELARIESQRQRLVQALEVYTEMMGLPSPEAAAEMSRYGDLAAISIPDGCQRIMEVEGGRAGQAYLTKVLEQGGKLKGKHAANYASVIGAMDRHRDRFRRLGDGQWELLQRQSVSAPVHYPPRNGGLLLRPSEFVRGDREPVLMTPSGNRDTESG